MSRIVNDAGAKAGSIYRIALKNFVTYKEVELFPGKSLNLIIGPNGTGKSTFVCAIILGLCGKTSVIGRAKKVSEYVRSGCQEATIEIELYQQPGDYNVIITRIFNLKDVTMWKIDNKTVREKNVQELIATMNIQVDNFCQLLPQDRVQDFSKMDPQHLLRSTLSAVGGQTSVSQLDELVQCREKQRSLSTRLQNNAQLLEEKKRLNERLKLIIDAMQQRKDIEKKITMCERKKYWIEYQEIYKKVVEYRDDKEKAAELVDIYTRRVDPLEKVLGKARGDISKLEQQRLVSHREARTLKEKIKQTIDLVKSHEHDLKGIDSNLLLKLERHRHRERELIEERAKLDKLKTDQVKLAEKAGDRAGIQMQSIELQKMTTELNADVQGLKRQKINAQHELENNIIPKIRSCQNQIRQLENVDEKRLEVLRNNSPDAYKALAWLRENRGLFKHNVYEPMMLEINFTDPKFARFLECTVPNRDLTAFTFENNDEMNLFLKKVRSEAGFKRVNAIHSQGGTFRYQRNDIEDLSYLGFYTYLADTITAPDPIIRYLCTQYSIHKIPIGNNHTYKNSAKVPSNITFFFTENHRFTVSVSYYSGARSSSTIEIRPPKLLANTIDLDSLENLKAELAEGEHSAQLCRQNMQKVDLKVAALEERLNELNAQRKEIADMKGKLNSIGSLIKVQAQKIQRIENEPAFNMQQEREKCRREQKALVMKQCKLHQELSGIMKGLQNKLLNGEMWKVKLDISKEATQSQESQLRELKDDLISAQHTLEQAESLLKLEDSRARSKLLEAKKSCSSKLVPNHKDFPFKTQFDELPGDLGSLRAMMLELQTSLECMDREGDERTIREYNEREEEIAALESQVNNSSGDHKQIEIKMNKIREKWLPPLERLLRNIDASFGDMFAKLGCAGEIKLDKAGSDDDYDKYGISILVRFRTSEQLQQLTRQTQSGGERALSTAVYLMALQRLTTVPFRCVDEINQGMDPINERKMFQLLVKATTECDNAQYFLLTPKLLTNLEYNPNIMVHTIMNGKQIMNYKKWKYQDFLRNASSYRLLTNLEYNPNIMVHTIMNGKQIMNYKKWKYQDFLRNASSYRVNS